jgi:hypothetical protein
MLQPPGPDISRDGFGRPLVVPPGGGPRVACQRWTTFSSALDDGRSLTNWKLRHGLHNLALRPDLVFAAAAADPNEKPRGRGGGSTLSKIADTVLEPTSAAATIGTTLHALTAKLDCGQKLGVIPEAFRADLAAYEAATTSIDWTAVETFRVHDEWKVAGTADRVGRFGDWYGIADIKTGKNLDYPTKFALQLAGYGHSQPYDTVTDTRGPAETGLDLARGLIIWLPAGQGRCELHWIDTKKGWEMCELAKRVWDARGVRGLLQPVGAARTFVDRARTAPDIETLRELWREAYAHNGLTTDFRAACAERRRLLGDKNN